MVIHDRNQSSYPLALSRRSMKAAVTVEGAPNNEKGRKTEGWYDVMKPDVKSCAVYTGKSGMKKGTGERGRVFCSTEILLICPKSQPTVHHVHTTFDDVDVRIDVTEAESKFGFRPSFRSWLPSREERMGRSEQLFRKAGKKRACEPLYKDQNDSQNIILPGKESPPVSTNTIPSSFWMYIYYLIQLPFFGVTNLVRRYYMSLLPFSGDICWEEMQIASWEISRQLFSALPFCDVTDEVPRECAGSSAPKMSSEERRRRRNAAEMLDDVEANASSPEEQVSALEQTTDFVQYADETENTVTAPGEITRLD